MMMQAGWLEQGCFQGREYLVGVGQRSLGIQKQLDAALDGGRIPMTRFASRLWPGSELLSYGCVKSQRSSTVSHCEPSCKAGGRSAHDCSTLHSLTVTAGHGNFQSPRGRLYGREPQGFPLTGGCNYHYPTKRQTSFSHCLSPNP